MLEFFMHIRVRPMQVILNYGSLIIMLSNLVLDCEGWTTNGQFAIFQAIFMCYVIIDQRFASFDEDNIAVLIYEKESKSTKGLYQNIYKSMFTTRTPLNFLRLANKNFKYK